MIQKLAQFLPIKKIFIVAYFLHAKPFAHLHQHVETTQPTCFVFPKHFASGDQHAEPTSRIYSRIISIAQGYTITYLFTACSTQISKLTCWAETSSVSRISSSNASAVQLISSVQSPCSSSIPSNTMFIYCMWWQSSTTHHSYTQNSWEEIPWLAACHSNHSS